MDGRFTAALVYNPVKVNMPRLGRAVRAAERLHGWGPTAWFSTTAGDPGGLAARTALAAGPDVVIVAGGDGTVRAVATEMVGGAVPLGIVPAGSTNLFATNLGIRDRRYGRALRVVADGLPLRVGAGRVTLRHGDAEDSRYFFVLTGFGVAERMVHGTASEQKSVLGWLAYVPAIARGIASRETRRGTITVDGGEPIGRDVHSLFAGTCGRLPTGLNIMPNAHPGRETLDLLTLRPLSPANLARLTWWLARENSPAAVARRRRGVPTTYKDDAVLDYRQATSLLLELDRAAPFQADGDPIGWAETAAIAHVPEAITVLVPATRRTPAPGAMTTPFVIQPPTT